MSTMPLSVRQVSTLRDHRDEWRSTDTLSTWAVTELEERGFVESEMREGYRYGRITDAGRKYLETLDDTSRQRA